MTTTTRIFASQLKAAPAALFYDHQPPEAWPELERSLALHGRCLVVGQVRSDKASGVPPDLPWRLLARPDVDYVLVEADGSRMLPVKAPAGHEPVIPPESTLVIPAAGIDALSGPIEQVAHRPELVAAITGLPVGERLTPQSLARLLTHPKGGLKGVPDQARVIPMLNKVESDSQWAAARKTAQLLLASERVERVVLGALKKPDSRGEAVDRVTAVVLAAGESKRMGQTKQLLPWGDSTILGQTLDNLAATLVHDVIVVTGHRAQEVAEIAKAHGAKPVYNLAHADGGMLSSLQAAVRELPQNRSAVLAVLADQPMVRPETIDQIVIAYWQGNGHLVAPAFQGRRGNPVLIDRKYFGDLLTLAPGDAPRTLLRRYSEHLHLVAVEDPNVLHDLDSPEDYQRWRPV
jgi:molybdenum cofactor cytidylyltransferase